MTCMTSKKVKCSSNNGLKVSEPTGCCSCHWAMPMCKFLQQFDFPDFLHTPSLLHTGKHRSSLILFQMSSLALSPSWSQSPDSSNVFRKTKKYCESVRWSKVTCLKKRQEWLEHKYKGVWKLTCESLRWKQTWAERVDWQRLSLYFPCFGWQVFYITLWVKAGLASPLTAHLNLGLSVNSTKAQGQEAYSSTLKAE